MDGWEDGSDSSRFKDTSAGKSTRKAGGSLAAVGQRMMSDSADQSARSIGPVQYRHGGKVRKTGPAIVHRGERVIPRSKVKKVDRMMKRKGMRKTTRGRR